MLRKTSFDILISILASKPVSLVMSPLRNQCTPIFMLHRFEDKSNGVHGHSIPMLRKCFDFLKKNGYQVVSLREVVQSLLVNRPLPKRSVVFTLDDGFYDQAEIGIPLFQEYGYPVTVFVATGMIDEKIWSWDYKVEYVVNQTDMNHINTIIADVPYKLDLTDRDSRAQLAYEIIDLLKTLKTDEAEHWTSKLAEKLRVRIPEHTPAQYRPMTWSQIKTLEKMGIDFGPHTVHHNILSRLDGEVAKQEMANSWDRLNEELVNPVSVFCYPSGREQLDFNGREKQLVKNLDIQAAVSADPGYLLNNNRSLDLFSLPRFSMPDNNFSEFVQYCSWIERAKQIVTHRI